MWQLENHSKTPTHPTLADRGALQDAVQSDVGPLRKVATTNGGEWAGPCPWCGGRDRFRVWPEKERYWCRGCGEQGDLIEYLRKRRGMTFRDACEAVGRPVPSRLGAQCALPGPTPEWRPADRPLPSKLWQARALSFYMVGACLSGNNHRVVDADFRERLTRGDVNGLCTATLVVEIAERTRHRKGAPRVL